MATNTLDALRTYTPFAPAHRTYTPFALARKDDDGEGRWVTIGAEPGEDGKNHGGTRVFIKGKGASATIAKGPAKMVGNSPSDPVGEKSGGKGKANEDDFSWRDMSTNDLREFAKERGIDAPKEMPRWKLDAEVEKWEKAAGDTNDDAGAAPSRIERLAKNLAQYADEKPGDAPKNDPVAQLRSRIKPGEKLKNHVVAYNGKEVAIDYVSDPKQEFQRAAMRVRDNLRSGEKGYVLTPKGEVYEIDANSKSAKPVPADASPAQSRYERAAADVAARKEAVKAATRKPLASDAFPSDDELRAQGKLGGTGKSVVAETPKGDATKPSDPAKANDLYDRAGAGSAKASEIDAYATGLKAGSKADAVAAAKSMGLNGMEAKSKEVIADTVHRAMMDRRSSGTRSLLTGSAKDAAELAKRSGADDKSTYQYAERKPTASRTYTPPVDKPAAEPAAPLSGRAKTAAAHVESTYEKAATGKLSDSEIDAAMSKLDGLNRSELAQIAESIDHTAPSSASASKIREAIRKNIEGRNGSAVRAELTGNTKPEPEAKVDAPKSKAAAVPIHEAVSHAIDHLAFEKHSSTGIVPQKDIAEHLAKVRPGTTPEEVEAALVDAWKSGKHDISESSGHVGPAGALYVKAKVPQSAPQHPVLSQKSGNVPDAKTLKKSVSEVANDLRKKHGDLVPIHAVRAEIAKRHGEDAASHAALDDHLWNIEGAKLLSVSHLGDFTMEQKNASIKKGRETMTYVDFSGGEQAKTKPAEAKKGKKSLSLSRTYTPSLRTYTPARRSLMTLAALCLSRTADEPIAFTNPASEVKESPALGDNRPKEVNGVPARYFWKQILRPGTIHHPNPRIGTVHLSREDVATIDRNTRDWIKEGGKPHIPMFKHRGEGHADGFAEKTNAGWIIETKVEADGSLWGLHQFLGEDAVTEAARHQTSVNVVPNFKSGSSGKVYPMLLESNALVANPVIEGLGEWVPAA